MSLSPAASAKILIVEDEPRLASVLRDYLAAAGMTSEWVDDGGQVIDAFARYQPDLVLLDLMLPQRDGVDLCRELRAGSDVPVIMVTARVEEIDRLLGLDIGADDYICKPFSPREVVARVVAVLRRYRPDPAARANSGLHIDEPAARATWNGKGLDLTPVEYRLLRTLLATPGRIWARDELLDRLYLDHRVVVDRTVDSHVRNLRRKLADAGMEGEPIRSVYGMGYSYEPWPALPVRNCATVEHARHQRITTAWTTSTRSRRASAPPFFPASPTSNGDTTCAFCWRASPAAVAGASLRRTAITMHASSTCIASRGISPSTRAPAPAMRSGT